MVGITRRCVDFVVWRGGDELLLEAKARSHMAGEVVERCLLYLHQWDCYARQQG